ncbi:hypothetical protein SG34_007480 [Thalassomonas viridans]|uniref:Uncharacterized protein n=1 Tax=Thalassomonas viridans TaxID=137584 RepID=A0AAF0CAP2_9GAMM|nr:hypothetical protein [Thalassomonas viridans]WDE06736.1 hypothetical protein SG34_007480 [Thalassomonas viridans]
MIKKILKAIGITILVLLFLTIVAAIWAGYKSAGYEETAVPYINKAIPEISKWQPDIMKSYMAPEPLAQVSEDDFLEMVRILSKMGKLISTETPVFQSVNSSSTVSDGSMTLVTYHIPAKYENGDANLIVVLKEKDESFEVYYFKVESMALFK